MSISFEVPQDLDKDALDLITMILKKEPSERPTIDEIRNHKWFQK